VSASTRVPGCITTRSTRPSVAAGIQRISSGTSVPMPRTWRTIGPRLTVSKTTDARATFGAAGLRRDTPSVVPSTKSAAPPASASWRVRRRRAAWGRGMSMAVACTPMVVPGLAGRARSWTGDI
jgi:hypothetical protein